MPAVDLKLTQIAGLLAVLALVAGTAGCGGQSAAQPGQAGPATSAVPAPPVVDITPAGTDGVDFTSRVIEVAYRADARLPSTLPAPAVYVVPEPQRPNPVLRQNRSLAPLTESIATRYGLTIRHEGVSCG